MRSFSSDSNDGSGASSERKRQFRSWFEWKEDGKRAYERGDYEHALESYRTALQPEYECPTKADQAVLWSNVVACRLRLVDKNNNEKDLAQARAAVQDAKKCVELNPKWAKGHLRLASAYIALGGHSNDACNELQSVLRLDPGNSSARQMLVRELRRDHANAAAAAAADQAGPDDNDSPLTATGRDPPLNPTFRAQDASGSAASTTSSFQSSAPPVPDNNNNNATRTSETYIDDGLTWQERAMYYWARVTEWYQNLNPDVKTLLKVAMVILCLYVAFGGRFGWEQPTRRPVVETHYETTGTTRGNYGNDNAYEEYYRQKQQERTTHSTYRSNQYDRRAGADPYHNTGYDSYYNAKPPQRRSSFRLSDLFDGSLQSMAILAGIAYLCHRNGINPFQAIMMLNMIGGGGRRRYGGGFGGGYGRRGYGQRRRGGFGW
mmetsp:Transcript_10180/g.21027  ORF Transcript_10180/g.21027 Transcript_10180/m.21027 type:complete len:434 (-) Transcript_10180:146-1447(-)